VSDDRATLELELESDPSLLATARLFAASAARAAGCDDDVVEDVRLAVSEACARSMRAGRDGDRIGIGATLDAGGVAFAIEGPSGRPDDDDIDGLDLVATLFPSTVTTVEGHRTTVRFDVASP
jgi:anti-sigma regulatory factor (Ser/Thr protein kinase)